MLRATLVRMAAPPGGCGTLDISLPEPTGTRSPTPSRFFDGTNCGSPPTGENAKMSAISSFSSLSSPCRIFVSLKAERPSSLKCTTLLVVRRGVLGVLFVLQSPLRPESVLSI